MSFRNQFVNADSQPNKGLTVEYIRSAYNTLTVTDNCIAFTLNPSTYELFLNNTEDWSRITNKFGEASLAGIQVFKVIKQTEAIIAWYNKELLDLYISSKK